MKPGEAAVGANRIFSGWMFKSSPALSALEHPVYDVGVLDCKRRQHVVGQLQGKLSLLAQRGGEPVAVIAPRNLDRAEPREMRRHELRVEQHESAMAQPRDEMDEAPPCWRR